MALSNRPQKSLYQIGDTVHFLNGKKMEEGTVKKVITGVTNPLADSTGVQEDIYFIGDLVQSFKEKELFHSKNALLFDLKGDYLCSFKSAALVYFETLEGYDASYTDFSEDSFDGSSFANANLEGAKFENCNFGSANFANANLKKSNFLGCFLNGVNFLGSNLTGATLPVNANTKSTFKTVVGAGHWDPVTTIWIDGQPIGN